MTYTMIGQQMTKLQMLFARRWNIGTIKQVKTTGHYLIWPRFQRAKAWSIEEVNIMVMVMVMARVRIMVRSRSKTLIARTTLTKTDLSESSRALWDKLSRWFKNRQMDPNSLKRTMISSRNSCSTSSQKKSAKSSISGLTAWWTSALFSVSSVCSLGKVDISALWRELWLVKRNSKIGSWDLRLLHHHRPPKKLFQSSMLLHNQLWFNNHKWDALYPLEIKSWLQTTCCEGAVMIYYLINS